MNTWFPISGSISSIILGHMKVLKALASTLLSLLLFICLIVMGVAVTLNSTALNAGFITGQIDKLDVVTLFNEEALPTIQKDEQLAAHPEVITSIQNTVEQNAPALKNAVNKAISDIYGYLLHGETLDLRQTLQVQPGMIGKYGLLRASIDNLLAHHVFSNLLH